MVRFPKLGIACRCPPLIGFPIHSCMNTFGNWHLRSLTCSIISFTPSAKAKGSSHTQQLDTCTHASRSSRIASHAHAESPMHLSHSLSCWSSLRCSRRGRSSERNRGSPPNRRHAPPPSSEAATGGEEASAAALRAHPPSTCAPPRAAQSSASPASAPSLAGPRSPPWRAQGRAQPLACHPAALPRDKRGSQLQPAPAERRAAGLS